MTSSWLLPLYRATTHAARPLVPAILVWRRRQGREDRHRIKERTGVAGLPRPEGRLVWLHAASTGDGQTLLPLIDRLGSRGFHVLLTTRTLASANMLKRMMPAGAFHQFLPFDVPVYVRRFLDHWQPDMVMLAGAEIWPNVLLETSARRLPVIFINARMTDRVYGYCRRMQRFVAALMRRVDLCLARTDRDAERFVEFGVASVQIVGDLVFDQPLPGVDPLAASAFASRVGARPIWIAALIDPDEAPLVLEAHRALLPRYPHLVTVVVPRLPRDGESIASAAAAMKVEVGLRSRDALQKRLPGVFVADVAGEIGLFYRAADIAFIGRSLNGGGRSPIDAAKLGCAILHGPRVDDVKAIYGALDTAHGGAEVKDAATLTRVLSFLFDDGAKLRLMQRNATQTMDRLCGGTARIMRAIEPHVVQMLVERGRR